LFVYRYTTSYVRYFLETRSTPKDSAVLAFDDAASRVSRLSCGVAFMFPERWGLQ
jgi:hypothetical protein